MTETEKKVFADAIKTYGKNAQTDMAIEEMSELTKALLKFRRYGMGDSAADRLNDIREEIEDVQIMLDQMKIIYGSSESGRKYKIYRLKERLDGDTSDRDNQS